MYPHFLKGYLYTLGLQYIRNDLLEKGVGAFAFFPLYRKTTDSQGKERTMEWALSNAAGNEELAKAMLRVQDDNFFGVAYVKSDGEIQHLQIDSRIVRTIASTLNAFIQDMQKRGIAVDASKLCDPNWMYRSDV